MPACADRDNFRDGEGSLLCDFTTRPDGRLRLTSYDNAQAIRPAILRDERTLPGNVRRPRPA